MLTRHDEIRLAFDHAYPPGTRARQRVMRGQQEDIVCAALVTRHNWRIMHGLSGSLERVYPC